MSSKGAVTAFTFVSGSLFSTVLYGAGPIPSDWKWGAYKRVESGGTVYHFFQRGGLLSDGAIADVISACEHGQTRKLGDMLK